MANMEGTCFPSVRFLANLFKISQRSVQRHIASLKTAGLLIARANHRDNGGQTSNLYTLPLSAAYSYDPALLERAERTPHETSVVPPHDTSVVPPTTPASPQEEETLTQKPSNEGSSPVAGADRFKEFWVVFPNKVEEAPSRRIFDAIVRKGRASPETLIEAAAQYANEVRGRDRKLVKHPTTWLTRECWLDVEKPSGNMRSPPVPQGSPRTVFVGPSEIRTAVVEVRGEAWAQSWLDPSGWDGDTKEIIPRSGFAGDRIRQELGRHLRAWGLSVGAPQRPAP